MRNPMSLLIAAVALVVPFTAFAAPEEGASPEYEMTTYYVGLLYRGPEWTPEQTDEIMKLQEGHMENIRRMADEGFLVLAGPFLDDGDLRGMFVFKVDSQEKAEQLVARDPAVQAGRLRVEFHPWYSASGIRIDVKKGEE